MIIKEELEDYGFGYTTNGEPIDESMVDELYRIANEIVETSVLAETDPYVTIDEDEGFKYWCDGSSYVLEEFAIAFRLEDLPSKWIERHNMFDFSTSEYWDTTDEYEIGTLIYVKNGKITDIVWTNGPDLPDYHAQIDYDTLSSWIKQLASPVAMEVYNGTTNI